jgi:hypothetical protein
VAVGGLGAVGSGGERWVGGVVVVGGGGVGASWAGMMRRVRVDKRRGGWRVVGGGRGGVYVGVGIEETGRALT